MHDDDTVAAMLRAVLTRLDVQEGLLHQMVAVPDRHTRLAALETRLTLLERATISGGSTISLMGRIVALEQQARQRSQGKDRPLGQTGSYRHE